MAKKLKPKINTTFGGIIDKTSYQRILIYIVCVILLFAILYFSIDRTSKANGVSKADASILDYLYFSVATFATLGYGDITPQGISKLLAIIEVLSGMFLAAVFIGKISSERQSTKLTLIYSSINHERTRELIREVRDYGRRMQSLYAAGNNNEMLLKSRKVLELVTVIQKYLMLHLLEGELASYGNSATLGRLYEELEQFQQFLITISKTAGVADDVVAIQKAIITSVGDIGRNMQQFHQRDEKIMVTLNTLMVEAEKNKIE